MNDFDKILWGFLFSASGIGLGWFLNQFGQWFRSRQEDKKNFKRVLFNLLEIYHLFVRSDPEKILKKVTERISKKIPDEHKDEAQKFIYSMFSDFFSSDIKTELTRNLKKTEESYQAAIEILATIDPLDAYYLSGRQNIYDALNSVEKLFEVLKDKFPEDRQQIDTGTKQLMETLKPDIINSALTDLEREIRHISLRISITTWFRSKKAITQLKRNIDKGLDQEIDKLFKKISELFQVNL